MDIKKLNEQLSKLENVLKEEEHHNRPKAFEHAKYALKRIETGLRYGEDMMSSSTVAFQDAIKLLENAIKELNAKP